MGITDRFLAGVDYLKTPVVAAPDAPAAEEPAREEDLTRAQKARRKRARERAARSSPPEAERPKGIGDALVGGLRAIGASIISTLGLGGSMLLVGSAVLWQRFDQAGLPATQSLQRVPEDQVLIEGIAVLALPVILALVAVLFVYALDPKAIVTRGSVAATVILALGAGAWALAKTGSDELDFWTAVALCFVALLLLLASVGVARSSENRFLPFAAAIFISTVVYTAALNVLSEAHQGNVQPVAVLRSPDGLGLYGFYVADTDEAIYFGVIRDGQEPVKGEPVALYTVPREPETRLLIGPETSWNEALVDACKLRGQLQAGRVPDAACGNLKASVAQYLALGDSYSSGEGAPPFDLGEKCHRSSSGWPSIMAASAVRIVPAQSVNLACSGATIRDLEREFEGDPPQLDRVNPNNEFVTISIGGNDAGFSRVLIRCRPSGFDCADSGAVREAQETIRTVLPSALQTLYRDLTTRVGGDGDRVIVVGYPRLLPEGPDTCGWLSDSERQALNELGTDLNAAIDRAAERAGVQHVDVTESLDGHELCSESPWINEITLNPDPGDTSRGHPTKAGQRAIADQVTEFVDGLPE